MSDKDLLVLSTPQSANDWPEKPVYESPWPYKRAEVAWEETRYGDREDLLHMVIADFDKLYSEALFRIWQLEGLLKGRK